MDPGDVTLQAGEVAAARLAYNGVQAIYGSIDLLPAYEAEVDVELGANTVDWIRSVLNKAQGAYFVLDLN